MPTALHIEVEEFCNSLTRLVFASHACLDTLDSKFERIRQSCCLGYGPFRCTLSIDCAYLEGIFGFCLEVFEIEGQIADTRVAHAIKFHFVVVSTFDLLPRWCHVVWTYGFFQEYYLRSCESALALAQWVGSRELEPFDSHFNGVLSYVALCQTYPKLWVLLHADLCKFATKCSIFVKFGSSIIIIYVFAFQEIFFRLYSDEFHLLATHLCFHFLWCSADVDTEVSLLVELYACKFTRHLVDINAQFVTINLCSNCGRCSSTREVFLGLAIVVVFCEGGTLERIDFVCTIVVAPV